MTLYLLSLLQGGTPASAVTLAVTTTQLIVTLVLGIGGVTSLGVAYGRLSERQKDNKEALTITLDVITSGLDGIKTEIAQFHIDKLAAAARNADWDRWRIEQDARDDGQDTAIDAVEEEQGRHATRLLTIEVERRTGPADRRAVDR